MEWVVDLEKLDFNKILDIVLAALKAAGMGWAGVAAGALALLGMGLFWWWWNRQKNKAAQTETDRKRAKDQAENAEDNAQAERPAKQAADDIEEIINDHERKG